MAAHGDPNKEHILSRSLRYNLIEFIFKYGISLYWSVFNVIPTFWNDSEKNSGTCCSKYEVDTTPSIPSPMYPYLLYNPINVSPFNEPVRIVSSEPA